VDETVEISPFCPRLLDRIADHTSASLRRSCQHKSIHCAIYRRRQGLDVPQISVSHDDLATRSF
jgi:hypothetical protein